MTLGMPLSSYKVKGFKDHKNYDRLYAIYVKHLSIKNK